MFSVGDKVNIHSKSFGKRLGDIYKYDFTQPQIITHIYPDAKHNKIYIISGDYYLENDITPVHSFQTKLDDKLFEI